MVNSVRGAEGRLTAAARSDRLSLALGFTVALPWPSGPLSFFTRSLPRPVHLSHSLYESFKAQSFSQSQITRSLRHQRHPQRVALCKDSHSQLWLTAPVSRSFEILFTATFAWIDKASKLLSISSFAIGVSYQLSTNATCPLNRSTRTCGWEEEVERSVGDRPFFLSLWWLSCRSWDFPSHRHFTNRAHRRKAATPSFLSRSSHRWQLNLLD